MTITPHARTTPVEQAKALLADAANRDRFYENSSIYEDRPRWALRTGDDAATALYAAQAANAHALLAIAGELAELREQVHEMRAIRTDLADIASAVRGLAGVMVTSAAQTADVGNQLADLTLAVETVIGDGLADIATEAGLLAALVDERNSRRWSWRNLFRRRRPAEQAFVDVDAIPEVEPGSGVGVCA